MGAGVSAGSRCASHVPASDFYVACSEGLLLVGTGTPTFRSLRHKPADLQTCSCQETATECRNCFANCRSGLRPIRSCQPAERFKGLASCCIPRGRKLVRPSFGDGFSRPIGCAYLGECSLAPEASAAKVLATFADEAMVLAWRHRCRGNWR